MRARLLEIHKIKLRKGENYKLRLEGLGSAGYSWEYAVEGPTRVVKVSKEMIGEPSVPSYGNKPPPTYSRDELFTITGLKLGHVKLHLIQRRRWESEKPPLKELLLEVAIVR